jgi:nucleotide-binding universal stress UspA family protein
MAGTILCGVDESMEARCAARAAAALSKQLELRLVLAHVGDAAADAEKGLFDKLAAKQGLEGVEQRIEVGDIAERLAQVAAEERAPCPVFVVRPCTKDHAGRESPVLADP